LKNPQEVFKIVDFDNETTITTAPKEIVKIILLERRKYLLDSIEYYHKNKQRGVSVGLELLGSRLLSLFLELVHPLKEFYSPDDFEDIKKKVLSNDYNSFESAFISIDKWFYDKKLTKIDTITKYDRGNVEEENLTMGL